MDSDRPRNLQPWPEISSLYCPLLESNLDFINLRNQLQAYITDSHLPPFQRKLHKGKSLNWQRIVYTTLAAYMRSIVYADDLSEQLTLLSKAKRWYWDRVSSLPPVPVPPSPLTHPFRSVSTYRRTRHATQEIFVRKKMDAVQTIEARSVSPEKVRHSPVRPAPVPLESLVLDWNRSLETNSPKDIQRMGSIRGKSDRRALFQYRRHMEKWTKEPSLDPSLDPANPTSLLRAELSRHDSLYSNSDPPEVETPSKPLRPLYIEAVKGSRWSLTEQIYRNSSMGKSGRRREDELSSPLAKTFYRDKKLLSPLGRSQFTGEDDSQPIDFQALNREAKVAEIEDVKRKMVLFHLPCTYRTLTAGLMEPNFISKDLLTPESLPKGGELFTINPFQELPAKKKGKKKK